MRRRGHSSLLVRIVAYQIIIGILPLLFFGLISVFSMNNVLKNEAIDFQQENVKQGALYINLVMDDVESLIANLSGIDEVNNALSSSASETAYDKLTTQAKIGYILSGYTNLKWLVSIDLFSDAGAHYHVGETLNATNIDEGELKKLFEETQESAGFVYWSGIESNINLDSEYSSVITATKLLTAKSVSDSTKSVSGLLVVSYNTAVFNEAFGQNGDPSSYSLILDSKNRIVYHHDPAKIGRTLSSTLVERLQSGVGYFTEKIDGKNMLVIYDTTHKGNWTVARFIPLSNIESNANTMTVIFVVLILLSVAVTGGFGYLMSRQITHPIKKVTDTFRLLQSGDFGNVSKLELVHQDEIGELGNLFNSFIEAREDITTQKKLERQLNERNHELQEMLQTLTDAQTQLVQQEKMAGIGQLAAGVAHEINNPLGFVKSNFSVLQKYITRLENVFQVIDQFRASIPAQHTGHEQLMNAWEDNVIDLTRSDLKEIIGDTQEGLNRIAEIVNALKTFSRSSAMEERTPYDLNVGIKTTLLIANNEIKYNSSVEFLPSPLPEINANGGQINQVLLNIIINAAQAIKQKKPTEKGRISIRTYVENDGICCEIEDNGCGMTEEVKNRIFEPFYTTKGVGQGTGLGLSLAYDIIVNKHFGRFDITSEFGVGTCFKFTIPINQNRTKDEFV